MSVAKHQVINVREIETKLKDLESRLEISIEKVREFLKNIDLNQSNIYRRKYYSEIELLRVELEEILAPLAAGSSTADSSSKSSVSSPSQKSSSKAAPSSSMSSSTLSLLSLIENSSIPVERVEEISSSMDAIINQLKLIPLARPFRWYQPIETAIRFLGVSSSFCFFGTFFSLPILLIRVFDLLLNRDPFQYLSEQLKMIIVWSFIYQSGIEVTVEGLSNQQKQEYFNYPCALMTFTHASNLDGFLVAGTCPIRQLAFGKKELFVVPFFSWLSLAIGGVPVDRGNRTRAINALRRSVESAKRAKVCIAIAPEGTRSTTGQLLSFKKGAFHIWEELRAPIVPFIIFGAFDLYPVGSWVNRTGKVVVRYLPPIVANQTTRDEMLRKVRRETLLAIADCPEKITEEISTFYWFTSILSNVLMIALQLYIIKKVHHLVTVTCQLTSMEMLAWGVGLPFAITAALYIYYVYLVDIGVASRSSKKN